MAEPSVLCERRDGIAHVTLNRPDKHNAMNCEMVVRLAELWDEIADEDEVRAILLTGAGEKAFSSGGDLGSLIPIMMQTRAPENEWEERVAANRRLMHRAVLRNDDFFKPVVAAVRGKALAGGMELLLATDIRVAATDATFALTEVRRGLIAGGGSLARLTRQLGWADAMEVALVGEPIDADHALRIGLINRVVAAETLLQQAEDIAQRIALGAPVALTKTKEAIVRSSGRPLEEAFEIETECTVANAKTEDAREGPRAFMEKREPRFVGR